MSLIEGYKRYILIFSLLVLSIGYSECSLAQTPGTNYTRTRIPQIPVTDSLKLDTIPVQRQAVTINYADALGRIIQSLKVQGSPNLMDVVTPVVYDNMGRLAQSYLPYPDETTSISTRGIYRLNGISSALAFYSTSNPGAAKTPTDNNPFSQSVFEASPLGRVNEQSDVGVDFQPGTGHTARASYLVNSTSDGIVYYSNIVPWKTFTTTPFTASALSKTILTDGNGHRLAVWKDLQGRTVTKTQLDAPSQYYSTDYVYNDLNQISYIIPPSVKKQPTIGNFSQSSFIFHYDSLGRIVEKKIPGKGWIYNIYNRTNQPILFQDSNMRVKSQWQFLKYDAEGRIIQTGIYTNKTVTGRKDLQMFCDTSTSSLWEIWQPGLGYTNRSFPKNSVLPATTPLLVCTTNYFDDYSFTEATSKPFKTNIYSTAPSMRTMGKLTGVSIYVLGTTNQNLVTINYYDNQNRLIQQIGDTHLGQLNVINNQYNFIGELVGCQRIITPLAGNSITLKDRFVYDHMDRLMDTFESFQGGSEVDISHNIYNEISQKVTEGLHSINYSGPNSLIATASTITENTALSSTKTDVASTSVVLNGGFSFVASSGKSYLATIGASFAQTQEFRYNIRDKLISINNGTLTPDNGITQSDPNALFGESITYSETSPVGATPQYNGNISGVTWRNKIEQTGLPGVSTGGQGYQLNYDNADRLLQGTYYTQSGNVFVTGASGGLSENISSYDEMGNINGLQRKDKSGNYLNNLTYNYQPNGNQLSTINDAGTQNISGSFTYDGNGNLKSDSRKGLIITYNYLDLPDTVKQGNSKLIFSYDAAGNRLYKQLLSSSGVVLSQRHYIGDAEVTASSSLSYDGKIESIAMDEGRIVSSGSGNYQYEYYLQDHLFTNRVTFRPNADGTLNVTQVQNYYPFGADMGDATMNYAASPLNEHKYNNKEWDPELNLNTYDFGARHYDPLLARWTAIDPLAEDSEELSPYNYVENNPLNLIDPDGMQSRPNYQHGFPIGNGSSGGSFGIEGWGLAGFSAATSFVSANKAFSQSVTTTNFAYLFKNVQATRNGMVAANMPGKGFIKNTNSLEGGYKVFNTPSLHKCGSFCKLDHEAAWRLSENSTSVGLLFVPIRMGFLGRFAAAAEFSPALKSLAFAGKFGFGEYTALARVTRGLGLEVHHLIEQRFAATLSQEAGEMTSMVLTKAEHRAFTNAWRAQIGYAGSKAAVTTLNATKEQIQNAARVIYKNYPEILEQLGLH